MTPKEKAKEIVEEFYLCMPFKDVKLGSCKESPSLIVKMEKLSAKQCALICVDEKMETIDKVFNGYHTMPDVWKKEFDELEEVKTEIEKL